MRLFKFFFGALGGILIVLNGLVSFNFGELISEGLAIIFCFVLLLFFWEGGITLTPSLIKASVPVCFFILLNLALITISGEWYRSFFLYPYVIILALIFLLRSKSVVDHKKFMTLLRILVLAGCVSAMYAVLQRLGYETTIPWENELRATGLSRTSLNLSGILFNSLTIAVICLPTFAEKIGAGFLLFAGLLSAGGRGAIVGALAFLIAYFYLGLKKTEITYKLFVFAFLPCVAIFVAYFWSAEVNRVLSAFDFMSDQSNIDRLGSYALFLDEFNVWGAGVGTTSPAVGRFSDFTGFESFFLNSLYEIGLPMFLLMGYGFLQFFSKIEPDFRSNFSLFTLGLLPMLLGQQMHTTPSVFAYTILSFALIYFKNRTDRQ